MSSRKTRKNRGGSRSGKKKEGNSTASASSVNVEGFIPQLKDRISNRIGNVFGRGFGRIVNRLIRRKTKCLPRELKERLSSDIDSRTEGVVNDLSEKGLTIAERAAMAIPFVGTAVAAVSMADTGLAAVRTVGANASEVYGEIKQVEEEEKMIQGQMNAIKEREDRIKQSQERFLPQYAGAGGSTGGGGGGGIVRINESIRHFLK